jgi:hypothetical protein
MSTTIPDFTQDTMDTQHTKTAAEPYDYNGDGPSRPNILQTLEQKPYGKSALWVSELRRRLNLTQDQLAKAVNVHAATIGSWERGDAQPVRIEHRASLSRAGASRMMPELPPTIGADLTRQYGGPRFDPRVEDLFKEVFGG